MEETITKKNQKNIVLILFSILAIVFAAGVIVEMIGYLQAFEASAQLGMSAGDFVSYFVYNIYMIGGLMGICALLFALFLLVAKERREILSKVWLWGVLLTSMLYVANFFPYLIQGVFEQELFALYIPWVALVVGCVALLAGWDKSNKKGLNLIELACLVFSIVFTAIFFYQKLTSLMSTETLAIYSVVIPLTMAVLVNIFLVMMYLVTCSKRTFDKAIYAMTDEEADIVEKIEARVEEIADEVEELAVEGEAFVEAKTELENAAKELDDAEIAVETETLTEERKDARADSSEK